MFGKNATKSELLIRKRQGVINNLSYSYSLTRLPTIKHETSIFLNTRPINLMNHPLRYIHSNALSAYLPLIMGADILEGALEMSQKLT